jgi:hypothetical protein
MTILHNVMSVVYGSINQCNEISQIKLHVPLRSLKKVCSRKLYKAFILASTFLKEMACKKQICGNREYVTISD